MNYSFIKLLNQIKTAFRSKKLKVTVKYSAQNLRFLKFLVSHGFLSSITKKGNMLTLFLKYESPITPAFAGVSITSKISHQRPVYLRQDSGLNLVVNLTNNNSKYTRLLARFR
jgi:ribosomal protein S8